MKVGYLYPLLMFLLVLTACGNKNGGTARPSGENEMKYSRLLRLSSPEEGVTVAEVINPWDTTKLIGHYVFLEEGKVVPQGLDEADAIRVPVKNVVAYTSVHVGALDELGHIDAVKGVADAMYFKLPKIREGLKSGAVADVGASASPSVEKIIGLNPEAIILNLYEGQDIGTVEKSGVPIIRFVENMEQSALGRAEWIKLLGVLTGERMRADSIFTSVEKNYAALREKGKSLPRHPKVLADNMYNGVWYVAGGKSYTAGMIADAGGEWPWREDNSTGSLNLSYEQVLDRAADADIWIIKGLDPTMTRSSLLSADPRYAHFAAVDKGGVWYCCSTETDIYEATPFHPDVLLAEYIAIFSGDKEKTKYFKPIGN